MPPGVDPFEGRIPLFVGGESVAATDGETFVTEDPATEDRLVDVAAAGPTRARSGANNAVHLNVASRSVDKGTL